MSRRVVDTPTSSGFYGTPNWCTVLIVQHLRAQLPLGIWLEPTCGRGNIILAVDKVLRPEQWLGFELTEDHAAIARRRTRADVQVGDARDLLRAMRDDESSVDVAISNNPFPEAVEIVRACLDVADWVINLQRLDWMESRDRRSFFVEYPPHLHVLPNRPVFRDRQDSGGYGWFVWHPDRKPRPPEWLPLVPQSLRAEAVNQLRLDGIHEVGNG